MRSTARCRFDAGSTCGRGLALAALVPAMSILGTVALGTVVGCDDPAGSLGTGGMVGTSAAGATAPAGGGAGGTGNGGNGGNGGISDGCSDGSASALGVASHTTEGGAHTVICSVVSYRTSPPSSGTHYPTWPMYKTYDQPVPWGFLVHGLEHGAVEIVYNCPDGCASEVASAQAWINGLPPDAGCPGSQPRVILVPDPTLDVRWAATAWTWTLRACAFDQAMFQQFFDDHYNHGLEVVCQTGADLSSMGWCP